MSGVRRKLGLGIAAALAGLLPACAAPAEEGVRWGVALEGNPLDSAQLARATGETGRKPGFVVFFLQWPESARPGGFPLASLDAIAAAGAMPVVTWEPMFYRAADGAETMIPAGTITTGGYDAYIEDFARAAARWGRPFVIRFAHEMNLSRYHWGGGPADYGPATPERFRAMWRHVVATFRRAGATNVLWSFSPNCESVPAPAVAPWNTPSAYYPGHDVVDLVGMDGYNWGDTQTPEKNGWRSHWRSFEEIFTPLRAELLRLAPGKPLYVFETASAPTGGDRAAWIAAMDRTAAAWKLAGVAWFQARKEVDWRMPAPGASSGQR